MVSMLAPSYIIKHSDVQTLFGKKGLKHGKRLGQRLLTVFSDYGIYNSAYMPGIYPKTIDLCKNF